MTASASRTTQLSPISKDTTDMSSVEILNVQKHYTSFHALKNINLTIEKGEFIVMVGPSGCGKSTLLKTIAGLETISSGKLIINGRDVTKEEPGDRGIAMVFQSYALYPHMTVAENMGFGLRMAKRPKAEIDAAVKRAAAILRIDEQLDKLPKQLSGGQRQRVAIGRAITRSPEVFLFDEPLSNLDAALRTQMRVELSTLHAELGSTMIYVTHDQVEAMTMASRIVVLNKGEIEQVGSPLELYANPKNHFVAGFLGAPRVNFFEGKVIRTEQGTAAVSFAGLEELRVPLTADASVKTGDTVTLGVRPERLQTQDADPSLMTFDAKVRLVEHLGRETIVHADASPLMAVGSDTGTHNVTIQLGKVVPFDVGSSIRVGFALDDCYLFGPDGKTLTPPKPVTQK
ncbi:Lactose transport ATP-binding protein LacK [Agrobacterium genomosp. 2 str. CFBP 5494]|uniref:ABC transporter ATP-binding protein n=5 Tax=Hyphomicrobiales TaxID=356 RepID=A0AB34DGG3_9HYPH|nr:ABC transporter ATP-binding protein [Brucella lupini]QCM13603.1 ABC transporter ATP-binding protein [Agrobacterium tumefaciens]CAD7029528.1 ABC transporter ATP-binding protein [Rhizobium sp. P007]CUX04139.1 Lactose transport ATP-binding protein LacK [Agrobacterium genomosp. 2 str. CFBP 5494]CZT37654.1 multiple sugar transport system ATP-binding protein [Rhizobium sp. 9140]